MSKQVVVDQIADPVDTRRDFRSRVIQSLNLATLGPLIALLLSCAFFAVRSDRFLTGENFSLIVQQVLVIAIEAIGQTVVILTAGIDLSCGAVMAFGSIVMTDMAVNRGVPPIGAIFLGLLATGAFGVLNGTLITRVRLPPFIVTLGTLNIAFALTQLYSNDQTISDTQRFPNGVPDQLIWLGTTFRIVHTDVTYGTILTLAMFLIAWYVLRHTAAGRHVYAVGNNSEAARLAGIPTQRLLLIVYTIAGVIYGIASLVLISRDQVGDPNVGQTDNLDVITAVVIGGTSLFGGRGSVLGTLIGALIVGVFRNGLLLIGVSAIYQVLITGILVILAVAVDQLARRRQK
jgi:fructose transport system permease protein